MVWHLTLLHRRILACNPTGCRPLPSPPKAAPSSPTLWARRLLPAPPPRGLPAAGADGAVPQRLEELLVPGGPRRTGGIGGGGGGREVGGLDGEWVLGSPSQTAVMICEDRDHHERRSVSTNPFRVRGCLLGPLFILYPCWRLCAPNKTAPQPKERVITASASSQAQKSGQILKSVRKKVNHKIRNHPNNESAGVRDVSQWAGQSPPPTGVSPPPLP